jgi:hypothetical protein
VFEFLKGIFEVFMAVKDLAAFCLHPKDKGSRVFRNGGILPHHYLVLQPRRPQSEFQQEILML